MLNYRTAGNIGEEQSFANRQMCFKPSKLNPSNRGCDRIEHLDARLKLPLTICKLIAKLANISGCTVMEFSSIINAHLS